MILNALLLIVHGLLGFIAALVSTQPVVLPDTNMVAAVSTANGYIAAVKDFIPNGTILAATAFLLFFELAYAGYKVVRWGYQKIPGIT